MDRDLRVPPPPPEGPVRVSDEAIGLVRRMLDRDVERRIVIREVVKAVGVLGVIEGSEVPTEE